MAVEAFGGALGWVAVVFEARGVVIGVFEASKWRLGLVGTRRDATLIKQGNDWWGPGAWRRGEMSRRPLGFVSKTANARRCRSDRSRD